MAKLRSIEDLEHLRNRILKARDPRKQIITVCGGTGCLACGATKVFETLRKELAKKRLGNKIGLKFTGCHGFCERGPLVVVYPEKIMYQRVQPEDANELIEKTIQKKEIIERLLYTDPATGKKIVYEHEVPFYAKQTRLIFGNNGLIEPTKIEDYLAIGGYSALAKVLFEMKPQQIIDEVKKANLRGRGGGGFPAGRKWEETRNAPSRDGIRYVICNADEGDPGAYKDRSLVEGNPHSVLEGMIIGAYAIGATEGYFYVRNEYPLAVKNVTIAIDKCRKLGLLGKNILGSAFDFDIKVSRGGGAFICGESTALMASLEGKIGEPRFKHIHTAIRGLWNRPSNLNNVETWANVPLIINRGAKWYSTIGTGSSKGTKIFSLVGKVKNTGLVEVPMGAPLRKIVYEIGGGLRDGKKFKAVQTGGPSGGCIPESLLDMPVDYEKMTEAGSMMGSGGMIVMDEDTCMVDIARYFLNFLTEESCGKCTPCREGIDRMLDILNSITGGSATMEDLSLLEELAGVVKEASLCQLGQTAPNPVLSTLNYFREEYVAHIQEKRCPARVCKALINFEVDPENCTGCGKCVKICPSGAASGEKKKPHRIDEKKCIKCGLCRDNCKFNAIVVS